MKTYKVRKVYHQYYHATIEADSPEQAQERAEGLSIEDCQSDDYIEWEVYSVDAITPRPLTPDQIAFVDAYCLAVCDAPRDIVEAFIREDDGDKFSEEYGLEYYSGLADAHNMWDLALQFSKKAAP
jgi:hypothetical protein